MALGSALLGQDPGVIVLDDQQRDAAHELANHLRARLDGPPGSGKTHVAAVVATAYAAAGLRVLYLCPRAPLAGWVKWNLGTFGVTVKTINGHVKDMLSRTGVRHVARRAYDDADFFMAGREAARPGEYDLVIGDEWQTTNSDEQAFVRAVVGDERFVEVLDSSRDMRFLPPRELDEPVGVRLEATHRHSLCCVSANGLAGELACAAAGKGSDSGPLRVTVFSESDDLASELQRAIDGLQAAGFAPSEIGVVSCLSRAESRAVELMRQVVTPPGELFGVPGRNKGIVADSFSYWLGLERRAIVVAEAPLRLASRPARIHTATSRACECVHVVLRRDEVE
jgi:hypothetical protein